MEVKQWHFAVVAAVVLYGVAEELVGGCVAVGAEARCESDIECKLELQKSVYKIGDGIWLRPMPPLQSEPKTSMDASVNAGGVFTFE